MSWYISPSRPSLPSRLCNLLFLNKSASCFNHLPPKCGHRGRNLQTRQLAHRGPSKSIDGVSTHLKDTIEERMQMDIGYFEGEGTRKKYWNAPRLHIHFSHSLMGRFILPPFPLPQHYPSPSRQAVCHQAQHAGRDLSRASDLPWPAFVQPKDPQESEVTSLGEERAGRKKIK